MEDYIRDAIRDARNAERDAVLEKLKLTIARGVVQEVSKMTDQELAIKLREQVDTRFKSTFLNALLLEAASRVDPPATLDEGPLEFVEL